jgi:putative Ca2+/H+ antiporter (TMEM165/GDT1 family)
MLKWIVGLSFIGMGVWMLIPDKHGVGDVSSSRQKSAFVAAFVGFLIAEIGDKTQIATAALAAHYRDILPIVIGSTLGMMIVNVPVVFGAHIAGDGSKLLSTARYIAAVVFLIEAALTFSGYKLF